MRRKVALLIICGMLIGLAVAHIAKHGAPGASTSALGAEKAIPPTAIEAQFDTNGNLLRPEGYRRWAYLSSGYGMSYSAGSNGEPQFTNVFVNPTAYEYFLAQGTWPEKAIFVLEEYNSSSHGSINKSGRFQQSLAGLVVEVKDKPRFADQWAYFSFGADGKTASAMTPGKNACWNCHEESGAVNHTFVQFYPELLAIARVKHTVKPGLKLDN